MPDQVEELAVYLHLARASQQRRRPLIRDRFLVLAAVRADRLGLNRVYRLCQQRVVRHNPGHLLQEYPQHPPVAADERFDALLTQLERKFPPEKAEHMLGALGIQLAGERATYRDAEEYALALLDPKPEELARLDHPPMDSYRRANSPSPALSGAPTPPSRPLPWWRFGQPTPWGNALIFGCFPAFTLLLAVLLAYLLPWRASAIQFWRNLLP